MTDAPSNNSSTELTVSFMEPPGPSLEPKWKIIIVVACVVTALVLSFLIYVVAKRKWRGNNKDSYWSLVPGQPSITANFPGPLISDFTPGSLKSIDSSTRDTSDKYKGGDLGGGKWIHKGRKLDCKDTR